MKIALMAAASSIHTIRWANGLAEAGHEVHVISQHKAIEVFVKGVYLHQFPYRGILGYFLMASKVRKLLKKIQPDILNAHYASGYGTLARLVIFHPYVLSVWGSDIYDFPYRSKLHRLLVRKNILAADQVASTGHSMAKQIMLIAPEVKNIRITPFGVDMDAYATINSVDVSKTNIVIGTVKAMSNIYGIDILIKAFSILLKKISVSNPILSDKMILRLVGNGPQTEELIQLAKKLGISDRVHFVGWVPHEEVPNELEKLDIYVALSRQESFGVAVIEAGAARRPVVVSNVGGLPEVVIDGVTGILVPKENPEIAAEALELLLLDPQLRLKMGELGRNHVEENYSWRKSIAVMTQVFEDTMQQTKK